jgi:hypothetical protein
MSPSQTVSSISVPVVSYSPRQGLESAGVVVGGGDGGIAGGVAGGIIRVRAGEGAGDAGDPVT